MPILLIKLKHSCILTRVLIFARTYSLAVEIEMSLHQYLEPTVSLPTPCQAQLLPTQTDMVFYFESLPHMQFMLTASHTFGQD